MPSLKIVLDTNALVSAFVFKGACGRIMDWYIEYADLYMSDWVLAEVNRVLSEEIGLDDNDTELVISLLSNEGAFAKIVPHTKLPTVCRDRDFN